MPETDKINCELSLPTGSWSDKDRSEKDLAFKCIETTGGKKEDIGFIGNVNSSGIQSFKRSVTKDGTVSINIEQLDAKKGEEEELINSTITRNERLAAVAKNYKRVVTKVFKDLKDGAILQCSSLRSRGLMKGKNSCTLFFRNGFKHLGNVSKLEMMGNFETYTWKAGTIDRGKRKRKWTVPLFEMIDSYDDPWTPGRWVDFKSRFVEKFLGNHTSFQAIVSAQRNISGGLVCYSKKGDDKGKEISCIVVPMPPELGERLAGSWLRTGSTSFNVWTQPVE